MLYAAAPRFRLHPPLPASRVVGMKASQCRGPGRIVSRRDEDRRSFPQLPKGRDVAQYQGAARSAPLPTPPARKARIMRGIRRCGRAPWRPSLRPHPEHPGSLCSAQRPPRRSDPVEHRLRVWAHPDEPRRGRAGQGSCPHPIAGPPGDDAPTRAGCSPGTPAPVMHNVYLPMHGINAAEHARESARRRNDGVGLHQSAAHRVHPPREIGRHGTAPYRAPPSAERREMRNCQDGRRPRASDPQSAGICKL